MSKMVSNRRRRIVSEMCKDRVSIDRILLELIAISIVTAVSATAFTMPTSSLSSPASSPSWSSPSSSASSMTGDYISLSSSLSSFVVRDFSLLEQLEEIVELASKPIPERPDGIVVIAKYTSASRPECQTTEQDYERLARENPATIFLRCYEEYDNTHLIFGQVNVAVWPTYDVFYGGNRVARVEGPNIASLEDVLERFQFSNSDLDLFSEDAGRRRQLQWGDGQMKDMTKTPRTTARFIPGYDWSKKVGAFDEVGEKGTTDFRRQL